MTPLEFLNELWAGKPDDQHILIWMLPDRRSRWFVTPADAAAYVESIEGKDLYVGVGLSATDRGATNRCTSDEVTGIAGLWADLDLKSDAHSQKALPETIEDALSIIPAALKPTLVIATGNGIHAWWLFKEPYMFDNDADRKEAASTVERWATFLRLRAGARGWVFDRLSDLARILRIPGTINYKDPANIKPVKLYSCEGVRYNMSDFVEILDDVGIRDYAAEEQAANDWSKQFADIDLKIDLGARIEQETLDAWMSNDQRFKNTWLRQRHDLRDPSQSGYDLALADFGIDSGIGEQRIVDLIIHHRTLYGQKARTRLDYYQRTIGKAKRRSEWRESLTPPRGSGGTQSDPDDGGPEKPPPTPSSGQQAASVNGHQRPSLTEEERDQITRQKLCDTISAQLQAYVQPLAARFQTGKEPRVHIVRIVQIAGKESTYHLSLNNDGQIITLEFTSYDKISTAHPVTSKIGEKLKLYFKPIKAKDWYEIAANIQAAAITEYGGDELQWEGIVRKNITDYLVAFGVVNEIDTKMAHLRQRPLLIQGRIGISSNDMSNFVSRQNPQVVTTRTIVSDLKKIGAKETRHHTKHIDQTRWLLPLDQYKPDDYKYANGEEPTATDSAARNGA